jgi:hypothetical protein
MNLFSVVSIIFALVGAAVYFGIVYVAGRKRWWWLALLVSLPAILAMISFSRMPSHFMAQSSSVLLRHFGTVGIIQLVAGAAIYLFGRSRGQSKAGSN